MSLNFPPPPPTLRTIPRLYGDQFDAAVVLSRDDIAYWFDQAVRKVSESWSIEEVAAELRRYGNLDHWLRQDPDAVQALSEFRQVLLNSYLGEPDSAGRRSNADHAPVVGTYVAAADATVAATEALRSDWWSLSAWTDDAVRWVETEATRRVTAITDATREAIRVIVGEAFEGAGESIGTRRGIERALLALGREDGSVRFGLDDRRAAQFAKWLASDELKDVPQSRLQRLIDRRYNQLLKARARTVAHTEASNAANAGQQATWNRAAAEGQLDANRYVLEWVARALRCPRCAALDGSTREIGGGMFISSTGESADRPPLHPNCLVGSTRIAVSGSPLALTKRRYCGPMVVLRTERGRELTVTANHPLLTLWDGWTPAQRLREGDHVFVDEGFGNGAIAIGELYEAGGDWPEQRAQLEAEDFHGDGSGSTFADVRGQRELWRTESTVSDDNMPEVGEKCVVGRAEIERVKMLRVIEDEVDVYNLHAPSGWYVAGGVVVQNCYCFMRVARRPSVR